jgi:hypothetical protein
MPYAYHTLGELAGRFWLNLHCGAPLRDCAHAVTRDATDLAEQYGMDYPLEQFLDRLKCQRCGHVGAVLTIWSPRQPDGADRCRQPQARVVRR